MSGRDTDIRRLNELTGGNVEFREFGASMDAGSSDWSLLNAVSRSVDPANAAPSTDVPGAQPPNQPIPIAREADWSMLTSVGMPPLRMVAEAPIVPEPIAEKSTVTVQRPTAEANDAKPSFGHLFRKTIINPPPEAQHTDLVQLLKAISRCH
ncbi:MULTISPECIES: hypothetical protein [unclassified Pseudomonas]|uniref:hypothetical protein n=1 Tax=unclassified Pseudomonas TaxID=196821 RepID=UPI0010402232|nr:hypothetical protein [Pseudomonas sp. IC_126]TCD22591.1 hypothetical protein E0D86_08035 [Pseudomonas sp. IC_126]